MKSDLKNEKKIRKNCNTINKLFEQPNFFQRLCSLSHNNIEEVVNNIFDKELSIICDQRYSEEQISKYIELIVEFLENN